MSVDVIYAVEVYLPSDKLWHRMSNCSDLENANRKVNRYKFNAGKSFGKMVDYRIMKITIKKERVG